MYLNDETVNNNIEYLSNTINIGKPIVNILWTGGWDSTFRILDLAEKGIIIQPYYISDNRKSESFELNAIGEISARLNELQSTKSLIMPLKILKSSEIPEDREITDSYNILRDQVFMGSQYDWLARFAKCYPGFELCIHKDDTAFNVIKTFGNVLKTQNEVSSFYILDKSKSTEDLIKVFGNFHFPILDYSKLDMKRIAENKGYESIMDRTWFCHSPINNEPCGICNPCKYAIEEGMDFRFSVKALKRYKFDKKINKLKIYRYIKSIRKRVLGY